MKPSNLEILYRHTSKTAKRVVMRYGQASGSWLYKVYKVYLEYRVHELQDGMDSGVENFNKFERGQYERKFLLDQEDLKLQSKHLMRKNIKKLCVNSEQAFLNNMLKREVGQQVLESHNITLPVCCDTACRWMHLCGADTRRISKNYYNDLHQDYVVIKYRSENIDKREGLYSRMAVWEQLDKAEEDAFMACASSSSRASRSASATCTTPTTARYG